MWPWISSRSLTSEVTELFDYSWKNVRPWGRVWEVWGSHFKSFFLMTFLTSSTHSNSNMDSYSSSHKLACCILQVWKEAFWYTSWFGSTQFFTRQISLRLLLLSFWSIVIHQPFFYLHCPSQLSSVFLPIFPDIWSLLCDTVRMQGTEYT